MVGKREGCDGGEGEGCGDVGRRVCVVMGWGAVVMDGMQ